MNIKEAEISYEYSSGNQFGESSQEEGQRECNFCAGVSIIRCMMISVVNKHNEEPNFYHDVIQKLVQKRHVPSFIKYQELLKKINTDENMTKYYPKNDSKLEIKQLLEYYKYRKFVPLFAIQSLGEILHSYYYERLRLYYNQIKKNLNLTVQDLSLSSSFSNSQSTSFSRPFFRSKILNNISGTFKMEEVTTQDVQNFRTESKALEDLVNFLKANEKFKYVRPLNVQSQWQKHKKTSKQMFRDTILQQKNYKKKDSKKGKSKIFITFYSREGANKDSTKGIMKNIKSQIRGQNRSEKLQKHKDAKSINKDRQIKALQKLEKIKEQVFENKIKQTSRQDNQILKSTIQRPKLNVKIQNKLRTLNTNSIFQSRGNTTIKAVNATNITKNNFSNRKSSQKLVLQVRCHSKNSPYEEKLLSSENTKKQSFSQKKLKNNMMVSLQKNKSTKSITNKEIQKFVRSKRILFLKQNEQLPKPMTKKQQDRPLSRRKSLDIPKMKAQLTQGIKQNVQLKKNQEYMTQRYKNLLHQTPKMQIRTANVSPQHSKRYREQISQITLQKSDNIVSIKKKKLQILMKKMQKQKTDKR